MDSESARDAREALARGSGNGERQVNSSHPKPTATQAQSRQASRPASVDQLGFDASALRIIGFTQSDDGDLALDGPDDMEIVRRIGALLDRDRNLGAGSLDAEWLCILLRTPMGESAGAVFVGKRKGLEQFTSQAFDHRIA